MNWIYGILKHIKLFMVAFTSLLLIYSSMLKFVNYPGMKESFFAWGYGETTMYVIGVIELLLAIGLFAAKSRFISAVFIAMLMAGALYTHIVNYEYDQLTTAIVVLIAVSLIVSITFFERFYPASET